MRYFEFFLLSIWGVSIYFISPILRLSSTGVAGGKWFLTLMWISPLIFGLAILIKNRHLAIWKALSHVLILIVIVYAFVLVSAFAHVFLVGILLR